ncbi:MAG: methionyl-tRNA formyltransferase [Rickettsiales bacterium]|nr:methionyl-tRNA formyltransferase [Rickettsiales bacterium]
MKKKVIFCGTPDFACPTLTSLKDIKDIEITHVITQPDKIRSRGSKKSATPIKELALKLNLNVSTPTNKDTFRDLIQNLKPDILIVIAYGMILPKEIVNNFYCINLHASLLPQYRGASPIQAALLNNDTQTGITLIHMNEKMDEGAILLKNSCNIEKKDNFAILHDNLAQLAASTCSEWIEKSLKNHKIDPIKQNHSNATYCKKIKKEDLFLDPKNDIKTNFAKIRAFSPTPGAYTIKNNKRIKILAAEIENNELIPITVKPEGKKVMTYADFKRGYNTTLLC